MGKHASERNGSLIRFKITLKFKKSKHKSHTPDIFILVFLTVTILFNIHVGIISDQTCLVRKARSS